MCSSRVGIDLHELIRLKLMIPVSFWIPGIHLSGLICMNWYDWNMIQFCWVLNPNRTVGIDLHELIRLKPVFLASCHYVNGCRDWSVWIDTIETTQHVALTAAFHEPVGIDLPELIRLKQGYEPHIWGYDASCRDWSAWIDTIETSTTLPFNEEHPSSGLIYLNWYDWNNVVVSSTALKR